MPKNKQSLQQQKLSGILVIIRGSEEEERMPSRSSTCPRVPPNKGGLYGATGNPVVRGYSGPDGGSLFYK